MKKIKPKTITLQGFIATLSPAQKVLAEEELKYYELLATFKQKRREQGITQEELAEKADVNRTTLSKIESGSRNATVETLMRVARALDMQLELRLS